MNQRLTRSGSRPIPSRSRSCQRRAGSESTALARSSSHWGSDAPRLSGLHSLQGLNPAARASRADSKSRLFSWPASRTAQPGWQNIPVLVLAERICVSLLTFSIQPQNDCICCRSTRGHKAAMRANRREPASVPFWFQSIKCRPHGGLLHLPASRPQMVARMAAACADQMARMRQARVLLQFHYHPSQRLPGQDAVKDFRHAIQADLLVANFIQVPGFPVAGQARPDFFAD